MFLTMRNISKTYSLTGTRANDDASLEVRRGEIHALVGENGAGKTTLMKILYGLERPDAGMIALDGKEVEIHSASAADRLGIGMVHQHYKLINEFTAAQNIVLGAEPVRYGLFFDNSRAEKEINELIDTFHFNLEAGAPVRKLSAGQKQQAEIIRLLYRKSSLLILDEPTSVLTEKEVEELFKTLRELRASGKTIILITHKLSEVKEISDRITVMRRGRTLFTADTGAVDEREISRMMVGADISLQVEKSEEGCREPVIQVKNLSLEAADQERLLPNNFSFSVSSCEILGITAAAGNGLMSLEDVLSGVERYSSGSIYMNDRGVSENGFCELRRNGMAYVPADRLHRGASLESSLAENLIILKRRVLSDKFSYLSDRKIRGYADELIRKYQIDGRADDPIGTLSGGNIQKAVLARELENDADIVLFSEPTWGLDIAASSFIYKKINSMKEQGTAVILLSSNIDEILALSDRILVMFRGKIVASAVPEKSGDDKARLKELIGEALMGLRDDYEG